MQNRLIRLEFSQAEYEMICEAAKADNQMLTKFCHTAIMQGVTAHLQDIGKAGNDAPLVDSEGRYLSLPRIGTQVFYLWETSIKQETVSETSLQSWFYHDMAKRGDLFVSAEALKDFLEAEDKKLGIKIQYTR